jgi:hypothetical protein
MVIRTFQPGDDVAQVGIYNEAAGDLPKFKPATLDEVRRRCRAADFDPGTRFYAVEADRPLGYAVFAPTGRVSFPWCRKGCERLADPLFDAVLVEMKRRGLRKVFAAYRGDWPAQRDFFVSRGFHQSREMVNYVMDLAEMPTPAARLGSSVTPLTPADLPAVLELGAGVLRTSDLGELEAQLFHNPYYSPGALFALRSRAGLSRGTTVAAVGIVVANPDYAHPKQLDSAMPCFRLGAFGTEGLTTKRINGVFSILAADTREFGAYALDLTAYAGFKVEDTNIETFAAQAPSDAEHLTHFYEGLFRRQGSFPIYEREL